MRGPQPRILIFFGGWPGSVVGPSSNLKYISRDAPGMGAGTEGWTTGFFGGMDRLDDAIKSMSAMLNRFNRADIFIGVGPDGEPLGIQVDLDCPEMIRARMAELMNRLPDAEITLESSDGKEFVRISAVGFHTPYSWNGWFYGRKCRPIKLDSGGVKMEWTETPTCAMKRHRPLG
jgi:hypothetical protein